MARAQASAISFVDPAIQFTWQRMGRNSDNPVTNPEMTNPEEDAILDASLALIAEANHTPAPAPASPLVFRKVAFYTGSAFGVIRWDCKTVAVERRGGMWDVTLVGGKIYVLHLPHSHWCRIVSLTEAITPDAGMVTGLHGVEVSRYPRGDRRWLSDFDEQLRAVRARVLWGNG